MRAVLIALAESGFGDAILSLIERNSGRIVGHVASGSRWSQVVDMTNRHLESNDILAEVVRTRQGIFIPDSRLDPRCEQDLVRKADIRAQYVAPLYAGDEMIGTLQVDLGDRKELAPDDVLLLQAFSGHIAVAISRLRILQESSQLASQVMSNSRFVVAEALSAMAVHALGHRLRHVIEELNRTLNRSDVRANRLLQETLTSWHESFLEVDRDLNSMLHTFQPKADPELTDVHMELRRTVDTWMPYLAQHHCTIRLELLPSRVECRIGAIALREIVSVLLVNAVQADAKTITIKSSLANRIEAPRNNYILDALHLDVVDDGTGLAAPDADRIFAGYTTKSVGHGLGLFIGRRLARRGGGELAYVGTNQSVPGATFRLTLPVLT